MKYSQEVSKSDLQAVKILLGHFLGMFHVWHLRIKGKPVVHLLLLQYNF